MKGVKTGGREKGTPNKVTQAVKSVFEEVADGLGGSARMLEWVKEDPVNERMFWKDIYPKLLPLQVTGADGGALAVEVTAKVPLDFDAIKARAAL